MILAEHLTNLPILFSTNTHIPSPYWFKVVPTTIPLSLCDRAASIITDLLGTEGVLKVLGGRKWWTLRGAEGVEAEWIAMKADVRGVPYDQIKKPIDGEDNDPSLGSCAQAMDQLQRVMVRRKLCPVMVISLLLLSRALPAVPSRRRGLSLHPSYHSLTF